MLNQMDKKNIDIRPNKNQSTESTDGDGCIKAFK